MLMGDRGFIIVSSYRAVVKMGDGSIQGFWKMRQDGQTAHPEVVGMPTRGHPKAGD
jgi:hypothetical protein